MIWRNLSTKMKDSFDVVSFLSKKEGNRIRWESLELS